MPGSGEDIAMLMECAEAARLGAETLEILRSGFYAAPSGRRVVIADDLRAAVVGTVAYPPDAALPAVPPGSYATRFEVCNETTLVAARRLAEAGRRPVALNFASARRAGGGFLNGARAQEESLARASGLYACLVDNPMYAYHRQRQDSLYSSYALYSPAVPVFRTDDGMLLEEFYRCAFISAPAPNANAQRRHAGRRMPRVVQAMAERIGKVLTIGAAQGHDTIILGAWGCGAFGNDPAAVASLFHAALTGSFQSIYQTVVFAVVDLSLEERFIGPFCRLFG